MAKLPPSDIPRRRTFSLNRFVKLACHTAEVVQKLAEGQAFAVCGLALHIAASALIPVGDREIIFQRKRSTEPGNFVTQG